MNITKDDYILRSLSKISKKKWEFFVISRIIHILDDLEIEFVTQQLVRRPDGTRALTDMYFPQFGIHLEIDEGQHLDELHAEADKRRTEDIQSVTDHNIHRIKAAERMVGDTVQDLPLATVIQATDEFVGMVTRLKSEQLRDGMFAPWDFEHQYDPEKHVAAGHISRDENVAFRRQKDALFCFGYTGGDYQRGAWRIPDGSGDMIWFPRLYDREDWNNELTPDRKTTLERPTSKISKAAIARSIKKNEETGNRIVFARVKDVLGHTLYRYVGTFKKDFKSTTAKEVRYDFVRAREEIPRQT